MGRRRKPVNLHLVNGNPSKLSKEELEKREAEEIHPHPVAPRRPADLSPLERECWDMHAAELDRLGLLTILDAGAFRLLVCQPYEIARSSMLAMRPTKADGTPDRRKKGITVVIVDEEGVTRRNPAMMPWKAAITEYRAGCREFGLTPAARVGLRPSAPIGTQPGDGEDEDDAFFGG